MRKRAHRTALLGDIVAAVFDEAARYSREPLEVSLLATQAVSHLLRRPRWTPAPSLHAGMATRRRAAFLPLGAP